VTKVFHVMLISNVSQEWYLVHKVDLHNHLNKLALETATLHTRCKITATDISGQRLSVILDDGRIFEADILLGADGLHV
jgi:salicylate hydroxylase